MLEKKLIDIIEEEKHNQILLYTIDFLNYKSTHNFLIVELRRR